MHPHRSIGIIPDPSELHHSHRIMDDVKRIGNVPEESAELRGPLLGHVPACACQHYQRKQEPHCETLVKSVSHSHLSSYARHAENDNDGQRTPEEAVLYTDRTSADILRRDASRQKPCYKKAAYIRIDEPYETCIHMLSVEYPASRQIELLLVEESEDIPAESYIHGEEGAHDADRGKTHGRQASEQECIEDIAPILEHQRPARAVEACYLSPASYIDTSSRRNHEKVSQYAGEEQDPARILQRRLGIVALEEIERRSYQNRKDNHRVKPGKTSLEELPRAHPAPTVIIGITCHKTAEHEEEIYSEITVIDDLRGIVRPSVGLHHMEAHYNQGSHATQSVKDLVTWLCNKCGSHRLSYRELCNSESSTAIWNQFDHSLFADILALLSEERYLAGRAACGSPV